MTWLLARLLGVLTGIFAALSWRSAQRVGAGLGALFAALARRDGKRMREHLAIAFPELPTEERQRLARACWRHLGLAAAELLHLRGRPAAEASARVEVRGFEHVEAARAAGRPVVVLTGHCGNWELISTANSSHGLGLAAIARELDDADLHAFSVGLRRHLGSETIARGSAGSAMKMRKVLKDKGALCLLIDQDIAAESVFVPFFGKPAWTPTAAATLALRLDAVVLPTFCERRPDGNHLLTFHPPLALAPDATEATAAMTAAIEAQIRRQPEQWVWMHRRWRRQPAQVLSSTSTQEDTPCSAGPGNASDSDSP